MQNLHAQEIVSGHEKVQRLLAVGSNKSIIEDVTLVLDQIKIHTNIEEKFISEDQFKNVLTEFQTSHKNIRIVLFLQDTSIETLKENIDLIKKNQLNQDVKIILFTYLPYNDHSKKIYGDYVDELIFVSKLKENNLLLTIYDQIISGKKIVSQKKNAMIHEQQTLLFDELFQLNNTLENLIINQTNKLRFENTNLESLVDQKKNLIRNLYHDLNNSLAVIIGAVGASQQMKISDKDFEEKNNLLLDKINRASKIQKTILTQVKDLDSLESGKKSIKLVPVSLDKVFETTSFIFKSKLDEKGVELKVDLKEADCKVIADETSLCHFVINNLVSNSIKFSNSGDIISISAHESDDCVTIIVEDQGHGIKESTMKNIFKAHVKTTSVGTMGEKGTGFGMPLVKYYLDYFGAEIKVDTKHIDQFPNDHGTRFTITFPKK